MYDNARVTHRSRHTCTHHVIALPLDFQSQVGKERIYKPYNLLHRRTAVEDTSYNKGLSRGELGAMSVVELSNVSK